MFRISYIVKNLIIINVVVFVVFGLLLPKIGVYFPEYQGFFIQSMKYVEAYYPGSKDFLPVQLISHMFMHASLIHIFFNMFMLYMFGTILEQYWGGKFFLFFYLASGFGAIALHFLVKYFALQNLANDVPPEVYNFVLTQGETNLAIDLYNQYYPDIEKLNNLLNVPAVGASGAVYGLLAGFGTTFPRHKIMLIFPPIPIEARILIPAFIIFEFFSGLSGRESNIAHFAHVGGAIIGFLLAKYRHKINL